MSKAAAKALSEIVDGQFFQTTGQSYMPRERAFPYVMGLLLIEELKRVGTEDIGKAVDDAIDRIRGFDRAAAILGLATALSLIEGAPGSVSLALFERWLGLQNVDEEAFDDIAAYVPTNPKIYLELLEKLYSHGDHPRKAWIAEALRLRRDHERVSRLLIEHLKRWMGTWCPNDERLQLFGGDPKHGRVIREQNEQRRQRIRGAIASLTKEERDLFERICPEVANAHLPQITRAISHIAAGWCLSPLAEGVLALSLTAEICERHISYSGLDWLFDANFVDFIESRAALLKVADKALAIAQSPVVKNAAARTYCFAGLPEDIRKFSAILKFPPELEPFRHGWHWLQDFCDSDPLDPNSPEPTNLAKAEARIGALSGDKVNSEFSMTLEQHHVVGLTGALARFNPLPIYSLWRRALDTLPRRDGLALRQFTLALPQVSPLLKPEDIAAIETHLVALNDPSHPLSAEGNSFVPTKLLEAIAPHLEGNAQLDLLARLPEAGERLDLRLADRFKPADPSKYQTLVNTAFENGEDDALMVILFFASRGKQHLTKDAAATISKCITHPNHWVRCLTLQIACRTEDASLLDGIRSSDWSYDSEGVGDMEAFYGSRALALAVARAGQPPPFERLSPELWSYACECSTDPQSLDVYAQRIKKLIERMIGKDVETPAPSIIREAGEHAERDFAVFTHDLEAEGRASDPIKVLNRLSRGFDPAAWNRENDLFRNNLEKIMNTLKVQDLEALAQFPRASAFSMLASTKPDQLVALAEGLLNISAEQRRVQIKNWALAIVPALATIDDDLGARLYLCFLSVRPFLRLVSGPAEIPNEISTLMEAQGEAFDKLRREAFFHAPNDERIALLTLSAEQNGRGEWVRAFARSCVAERQPMRISLGLTILGFCDECTVPSELREYEDLIGDLAITANLAKNASERNAWARHWQSMAFGAATPEEMWRYGELMVRAADFRFILWLPLPGDAPVGSPWQRFCLLYPERLVQRGKKETAERMKKLYGLKPPPPPIDTLLGLTG